jgi:hypothetical protein
VRGDNAPTLGQPNPSLHLPPHLACRTGAIKQGGGDGEVAAVRGDYGSVPRARQVPRGASGAKRRHLRMAVKVLGEAIADRARILVKQGIEGRNIVADQRLFVTRERRLDLGHDVRQVNFHACTYLGGRGASATPSFSKL